MNELIPRRKKHEPVELQLTAMIDIFSLIVIFLILGSVFGAADMVVPPGMTIPKSVSKEGIESAPRVSIEKSMVRTSLSPDAMPLTQFQSASGKAEIRKKLSAAFQEFKQKRKDTAPSLNLLADENARYEDVFDVVSTFRSIGFGSILFVASGEKAGKE